MRRVAEDHAGWRSISLDQDDELRSESEAAMSLLEAVLAMPF